MAHVTTLQTNTRSQERCLQPVGNKKLHTRQLLDLLDLLDLLVWPQYRLENSEGALNLQLCRVQKLDEFMNIHL